MPMTYWLIVAGLVVVLLLLLFWGRKGRRAESIYQRIERFLSPAEQQLMAALRAALPENVRLLAKVRVADVLTPSSRLSTSDWQKAFNRISAKHFDFLVCRAQDYRPLCAIELDDRSHLLPRRRERDDFLDGACREAGFTLLRVTARREYSIAELTATLAPHLSATPVREGGRIEPTLASALAAKQATPPTATSPAVTPKTPSRVCPLCAAPLVLRRLASGEHAGIEFWACSRHPACRHVETADA